MNGVGPVTSLYYRTTCTYRVHSYASTILKAFPENWVVTVQHCGPKQRSWRPRSRTTWLLGKESPADFPTASLYHDMSQYDSVWPCTTFATNHQGRGSSRPQISFPSWSPSITSTKTRRRVSRCTRDCRDCWNGQKGQIQQEISKVITKCQRKHLYLRQWIM